MRLMLKIAPSTWPVMLGRQVADKTDDPSWVAVAIIGLKLMYKGKLQNINTRGTVSSALAITTIKCFGLIVGLKVARSGGQGLPSYQQ